MVVAVDVDAVGVVDVNSRQFDEEVEELDNLAGLLDRCLLDGRGETQCCERIEGKEGG